MSIEGVLSIIFSICFSCLALYYILQYERKKPFEGLFVSLFFSIFTFVLLNVLQVHASGYREIYVYSNSTLSEIRTVPIYEHNPFSHFLLIPLFLWIASLFLYVYLYVLEVLERASYIEIR